ncbi:hypothetical protein [Micromonospora avicenniae]|uniref:hypothetical protein n=1 Tax=Micromonospora avicenniae TaxID=1198245 RepID=UPI0033280744
MRILRKLGHGAIVGVALAMLVGCGSDDTPGSTGAPGTDGVASAETDAESGGTDAKGAECERLPASEVAEVIGPNDGGQHDYTLGGCIWTASSGAKEGVVEAVSATVLPQAEYEAVAEIGEQVSGSAEGATYDSTHGELWFPCGSGEFCGIKVSINDPDKRRDVALRLGKSLQGRV